MTQTTCFSLLNFIFWKDKSWLHIPSLRRHLSPDHPIVCANIILTFIFTLSNSQDVDLFPQEDVSQIFPQAREVTYQPAQLTMTDKSAIEISKFFLSVWVLITKKYLLGNYGKMNPEPELNTPLIQDEFQDPLKHLLKY